jgi:hypothetical protein
MPYPFAVGVDRALDALVAAWGSEYPEIRHLEGTGRCAYRKDAGDREAIQADTPDELDAKIRAD